MKDATEALESQSHATIETVGGSKISVPDNAKLMTPFILLEQGDWFEDDIKWVRSWLQPGMCVLDIGTNYGLYSSTACQAVGSTGRVWSVEPTPTVLEHLRRTQSLNGFEQQTIIPLALSDQAGQTTFYTSPNAELNSLHDNGGSESVTVSTDTLDALAAREKIDRLDFVKLDAEGQELPIIDHGGKVFEDQSPVVLFEVSHSGKRHLELVDRFRSLGYSPYYLMPEFGILAPFNADEEPDPFWLNFFGCKADRAECIEPLGLLATSPTPPDESALPLSELAALYRSLAYGGCVADACLGNYNPAAPDALQYAHALVAYLKSRDASLSANERVGLLQYAFRQTEAAVGAKATFGRTLTYCRLAWANGQRSKAVRMLNRLASALVANKPLTLDEPFLVPDPHFDQTNPQQNLANWIKASVIEAKLRLQAYSFYFNTAAAREGIEQLRNINLCTPSMKRRADFLNKLLQRPVS